MTILWFNLAIVFIISYFSRYFAEIEVYQNAMILTKPNKPLIIGVLICMVAVSGLRENIGDTYFYKYAYINNKIDWNYVISQKDYGFGVIQMILKNFTNDPQYLIFISALITNVLIILVLYKYSGMVELSIYVYITSGQFLTSMNGIRQYLAAAIVFAATKYLINGSWKRYFLLILLASTIHQTALILLPIYFIVRRKAWTKSTFILLLIAVFIVLGFNQFSDVLFSALKDSQYSEYQNFNEGGANINRVAVEMAPLLIAFLGRDKLRKIMPNSDFIVNLALLSLVFMIISTRNWIFARFSIYFDLYQLLLISWVVKLFNKNSQRLIYFLIIICYLIFHFYESVVTLDILYKSNFLDPLFGLGDGTSG